MFMKVCDNCGRKWWIGSSCPRCGTRIATSNSYSSRRRDEEDTMSDPLNPANPLGLTSPISPLNGLFRGTSTFSIGGYDPGQDAPDTSCSNSIDPLSDTSGSSCPDTSGGGFDSGSSGSSD